ncbi:sigma-70 family RNA polymerase sigma factor [Candidatus Dojkabacteria bacterium]|nr:sigma-70 family RNA polymerase sigma factor [Candidatus Dojkabacteria bacterium]
MKIVMNSENLKQIYKNNISSLYKFFFFKTLNRDIAEDLTSETFLILAKQNNEIEIESVDAYLKGIARNVFNSYLRRKYKSPEVSVNNERFEDISEKEEADDNGHDYTAMLSKLLPYFPNSQRIVMELRFIQKLSIQEIAKKLGKNENYVSTTQKRAFKTLRKILSVQKKQLIL